MTTDANSIRRNEIIGANPAPTIRGLKIHRKEAPGVREPSPLLTLDVRKLPTHFVLLALVQTLVLFPVFLFGQQPEVLTNLAQLNALSL